MSKFLRKKFYPPPYTRKIKNISQTPLRPAAALPAARRQPYPRAHIRSIKAPPIARGMESVWKILQSAFYFHLRLSRAKFQQEGKNLRTARRCRAPLPRCNFDQENNTHARLPALLARENPPPPAGTRQFFAAKLQPPAAKFALPIHPAIPENFRIPSKTYPPAPRQYDAPRN